MELDSIYPWDGMEAALSSPNGMPTPAKGPPSFGQEKGERQHFVACEGDEFWVWERGVFIGHVRGRVMWQGG